MAELKVQSEFICSIILLKGNAAWIQESFLINIKIIFFPQKFKMSVQVNS